MYIHCIFVTILISCWNIEFLMFISMFFHLYAFCGLIYFKSERWCTFCINSIHKWMIPFVVDRQKYFVKNDFFPIIWWYCLNFELATKNTNTCNIEKIFILHVSTNTMCPYNGFFYLLTWAESLSELFWLHVVCRSSVHLSINCSHFHLLLKNHWANFNQTCHKALG